MYLGRCTEVVRAASISRWSSAIDDVLTSYAGKAKGFEPSVLRTACRGFDFLRLLSTESEMLGWKAAGLPSDALSMENTVVVLASSAHSGLCPFLVDPAALATEWLHRHLDADKGSPVEVLSAQDARFQTQVRLKGLRQRTRVERGEIKRT